jgi:hypothetical protein
MSFVYDILDLISKFGIFVTLVIFGITLYRDRKNKKKESNERLCRVCNTLLVQINELDEWYKKPEYEALKRRHYTMEYSENIINIYPYEGIINSGLITYLKVDTQKKLNDYYFVASVHNKRMYSLAEIYNNKGSTIEFKFPQDLPTITESESWKLNETELTRYEKMMRD